MEKRQEEIYEARINALQNKVTDLEIDKQIIDGLYGDEIKRCFEARKNVLKTSIELKKQQDLVHTLSMENQKLKSEVQAVKPKDKDFVKELDETLY